MARLMRVVLVCLIACGSFVGIFRPAAAQSTGSTAWPIGQCATGFTWWLDPIVYLLLGGKEYHVVTTPFANRTAVADWNGQELVIWINNPGRQEVGRYPIPVDVQFGTVAKWRIDYQNGTVEEKSVPVPGCRNTPTPPATPTAVPPTSTPTNSPVPPTATSTSIPPTATNTNVPPTVTATPVPPTVTMTVEVPPTATATTPATDVPPTSTPTNTSVPPTVTPTVPMTQVSVTPTRTNTSVPPVITSTATPPKTTTNVPPTATNKPPKDDNTPKTNVWACGVPDLDVLVFEQAIPGGVRREVLPIHKDGTQGVSGIRTGEAFSLELHTREGVKLFELNIPGVEANPNPQNVWSPTGIARQLEGTNPELLPIALAWEQYCAPKTYTVPSPEPTTVRPTPNATTTTVRPSGLPTTGGGGASEEATTKDSTDNTMLIVVGMILFALLMSLISNVIAAWSQRR